MRARGSLSALLASVPLLGLLSGCSGSDPVSGPASDPVVVQLAAARAAVATSDASGASDTVTGLLSNLTPLPVFSGSQATATARSLSTTGSLQSAASTSTTLSCPASGALDNGVTFTCVDVGGTLTFSFGGSVLSSRGSVTLEGSLVANPSAQQPADGTRFDVDFVATTSGPAGAATWSGHGLVDVNGAGQVVDYSLTMTHSAPSSGGGNAVSTITVTPDVLDVLVSAGAVEVRFVLDRATLYGTVQVNGTLVANVTVIDGCMVVDYLDGSRADDRVCP